LEYHAAAESKITSKGPFMAELVFALLVGVGIGYAVREFISQRRRAGAKRRAGVA
jgi:hypothetical protein